MTRPPLGIDDKLWLEYIDALDEHNQAELKPICDSETRHEKEYNKEVLVYNSLPWWRRKIKSKPYRFRCYSDGTIDQITNMMTASLEGFLTWKAKGKKL